MQEIESPLPPVLIVGAPRSGTTWVGHVLGVADGVTYVHEPDNEGFDPLGFQAKASLHRFPCLAPDREHAAFEALWRTAFSGAPVHGIAHAITHRAGLLADPELEVDIRRRCSPTAASRAGAGPHGAGRRLPLWRLAAVGSLARAEARAARLIGRRARPVVKSVHAALCLEWLTRRHPATVIVVLRSPLSVIASCLRLGLSDADRDLEAHSSLLALHPRYRTLLDAAGLGEPGRLEWSVRRMSRQLVVLADAMEEYATAHPDTTFVVHHEALCDDPSGRFRRLYEHAGLEWGEATLRRIETLNRPGRGFYPERRSEAQIGKWRQELTTDQVRWVREEFERAGRPRDLSSEADPGALHR